MCPYIDNAKNYIKLILEHQFDTTSRYIIYLVGKIA